MAFNNPPKDTEKPPQFVVGLNYGKYSNWSVYLDGQTLLALLWATGVLGNCLASIKAAGEEQPLFEFEHPRVSMAMDVLFQIQQTGQTDFTMGSEWDQQFSETDPILTEEFAMQLAEYDETIWAQNICERSLALVLWMIGEYGCRASRLCFPNDSDVNRKLQAVLLILLKIFQGKRCTIVTDQRILEEPALAAEEALG